jgi:hypothetical protein
MSSGYVYVLSNPAMPGFVKVGRSIHGGHSRGRSLYQTGVPAPYVLEFEIYAKDHEWLEAQAHKSLRFNRANPDREFFKCPPNDAIEEIIAIYSEWLCSSNQAPSAREAVRLPEPEPRTPEQAAAMKAKGQEALSRLKAMFDDEVRA